MYNHPLCSVVFDVYTFPSIQYQFSLDDADCLFVPTGGVDFEFQCRRLRGLLLDPPNAAFDERPQLRDVALDHGPQLPGALGGGGHFGFDGAADVDAPAEGGDAHQRRR